MRGISFKLLGGLLLLAGCAHAPSGIQVQYVDRPVIQVQKCIKATEVPQRPASLKSGPVATNLEQALSLALAKVSEWTRYGDKADVVLSGCVQ